ncbi:class II aldolase/adducin family protein [Acidiferrobacter sp.]|uniref:class II aldolase/adducin family protein n=1 Tax=Acidiferrobacter sp. TaxID=1872107 RepID=UPI002633C383|nr:class II aldolase/adducin family protein [Acidiferrobacter sp.]
MGVLEGRGPGDPPVPEGEGVTKFRLHFTRRPPLLAARLATLQAWRQRLFDLGLIGQELTEAGPVGFGNVSERYDGPRDGARFVITATQTGHKPTLTADDYSLVTGFDLDANRVDAEGPAPPSSESLTHAIFYASCADVRYVFHGHSREIWTRAEALGLSWTDRNVPYGTPEMAREVQGLLERPECRASGLLVMGGHENGLISFAASAEVAGTILIQALARARAFDDRHDPPIA